MSDNTNKANQKPVTKGVIEPSDFQVPGAEVQLSRFRPTLTHFALLILAVLSVVFISFITLAKSIQVIAVTTNLNNPKELYLQSADLKIHSSVKLPLGNRVLVLPGEHVISLSAPGFELLNQTLQVVGGRHQQFEIVMTRLPGNLDISVPEGVLATAIIDGEKVGEVPGVLKDLPAGLHELTIDADLYRPFSTSVIVQGKGETQALTAQLEPAWAEYLFRTIPEGADIHIDGVVKAKTPATVKVEEGSRSLTLAAVGYKPYEQELSVVAQEKITAPEIQLIPADGLLELESAPSGAAVILNNEFQGVTPMSIAVKPNHPQSLKIYKAGYQLAEQSYTLNPDETELAAFDLSADLVRVKISVSPADAAVFVDGAKRGNGSQDIALNSLPHSISVRKPGYVTQRIEIVPTRRSKQVVSFQLLTEEQHYWAQIPNSYTNRSGHEMKLFKQLGNVKLGSSRREDGRRANEVVYEAELTKPFYVALYETTNKQFRQFKPTHNAGNYKGKSLDANKAPALNISWQQAAQYCNWLSKKEGFDPFYKTVSGYVSGNNPDANGYRLLTEVEWSWLARNKNSSLLTYPWGNSKAAPQKDKVENFADEKARQVITFTLDGYNDGYTGPSPVGRFPANHRGIYDIGGNAAEWVNDWYSAKGNSELVQDGLAKDPLGPDNGEFHVVRGASWARGHLPQLRLAYRDYGAKGAHDIGFRIARYAGLNKSKNNQLAGQ